MNLKYTFAALFLTTALFTGCSNDTEEADIRQDGISSLPSATVLGFAPDNGAKLLTGTPANMVNTLLKSVGPDVARTLGSIKITSKQYDEIKLFTDELVKDCQTEKDKYTKIFNWVYKNLEYTHEDENHHSISNDPYPVFKTRRAICQGFANLQHVMLHSQGIPAVNVNGDYVGVGGHAWNYVYLNNIWWVSDPTNNGSWSIIYTQAYKHLAPYSIDAKLFETDEFVCTFNECALNIDEIKTENSQFTVPFGVGGFKVTSLNPTQPVPTSLKEIFIGKNVTTLGEYYMGLLKNAPSVEAAYVEEGNNKLESFGGAVYKKNNKEVQLYYLPAALKRTELKVMPVLEKNTVFMHNSLEEVIIPAGTKEICNYAFEKCPNLRVAYVPEGTKIEERAFWDVHPDFKVVRGDYTGIPQITI